LARAALIAAHFTGSASRGSDIRVEGVTTFDDWSTKHRYGPRRIDDASASIKAKLCTST